MITESLIRLYLLFKVITMGIGLIVILMGFILFIKGFSSPTGQAEVTFLVKTLRFNNASPGVYLFILGGVIFGIALYRGVELKSHKQQTSSKVDSTSFLTQPFDTVKLKSEINIDSLFKLAEKELNNNKLLNAYKLCCFAKGVSLSSNSVPARLKDRINFAMSNMEKQLNIIASKGEQTPLTSEETQSVTISEDRIDTTK